MLDAAASYSDTRIYRHKAVEIPGPAAGTSADAQAAEMSPTAQAQNSPEVPPGVFQNGLVKITPVILSYDRHQVRHTSKVQQSQGNQKIECMHGY